MWVFSSTLLTLVHLLCLTLPITAAMLGSREGDNGENNNFQVENIGGSGVAFPSSYSATVLSDLMDVNLPPALRVTSAIRAFTTSKRSSPDFWEMAKKYEKNLQEYVPRLLEDAATFFKSSTFTEVSSCMHNIVNTTATFRDSIQGALDAHHVTLDALTEELEHVFVEIGYELESIPTPDKAAGHAERAKMVEKVLDDVTLALFNFAHRNGIDDEIITNFIDALKPQVLALIVTIGDINEQYPQLFPILSFSVATLLIPELWFLRIFLRMFGFGPLGPIKGTTAAWMQRYFWGAAVKEGSFFSMLQAAGMGKFPKWAWLVTKLPLLVGGLAALLSPCFGRRRG